MKDFEKISFLFYTLRDMCQVGLGWSNIHKSPELTVTEKQQNITGKG